MTDKLPAMRFVALLLLLTIAACGGEPEPAPVLVPAADRPPQVLRAPDWVEPPPDFAALRALGYASASPTPNPDERGVVKRVARAFPGLNLYTSRRRAGATLVDMEGRVVHRWRADPDEARPKAWMHVEPLPDGSLVVIAMDSHLTKVDWHSRRIWRLRIRAHHDVAVREDGGLLALVRSRRLVDHGADPLEVLADAVAFVSPEGRLERKVELLPLLRGPAIDRRLARLRSRREGTPSAELLRDGGAGDLLHANSIDILRRAIPGIAPDGAVLISFRNLDRVAILDADLTEVLWLWGEDELQGQHDATQLPNGNLLIFDNGTRRGRSRAIEVDPRTGGIVRVATTPGLFTRLRGGAQRLANGNTLITESDRGHAIELAPDGEIVWEMWNPDVRRHRDGADRAVIYRLARFPEAWFPGLRSSAP